MEGAENLDASTVKKVAVTALPPSLLPPPSSHLPPPPQDIPSHLKSLVEGGAAPAVAKDFPPLVVGTPPLKGYPVLVVHHHHHHHHHQTKSSSKCNTSTTNVQGEANDIMGWAAERGLTGTNFV